MAQSNDHWPLKHGFRIGHLNINHIMNKMADVTEIVQNSQNTDRDFHMFCFSESRLNDHIDDKEVSIAGFHIIRKDALDRKETGLIVYINEHVSFKRLTRYEEYGIECVWLEVKMKKSSPILVGFLYRNPSEPANWVDKFVCMMDSVWLESKEIILMGDFNIDLSKANKLWTETFSLFNLSQIIDSPTRVTPSSRTLIDHIYSSTPSHIQEVCVPVLGVSDHYPVCCTWSKKGVKIPKLGHTLLIYRSFAKFNEDKYIGDLRNAPFSDVYNHTDPDDALNTWYSFFNKILDKHAPQKMKRTKHPVKPEWLTPEIRDAMRHRDYLLRLNRFDEYKRHRNKVTYMIRDSKKKFFEKILTNSKDSKGTWKAINLLTNKNSHACPVISENISPDELNNHFCTVYKKVITVDNSSDNNLILLKQYCQDKITHRAKGVPFMAVSEVFKSLCQLKQSNTKGTDRIDGKIIRLSAPFITDTITYIYNLIIEKNKFPRAFKEAKVIPLYKSGERSDPSNYRPISILSVLSKPVEKHINEHIMKHFLTNDLLHKNQSGFRPNHSCHTALTELIDAWLSDVNLNKLCGALFIDFAKAFDVISHNLLLKKMNLYGLTTDTLNLIRSFLSDRHQVVSVKNKQSEVKPVVFGVPQGSVLGPLLFSICINDLPLHISSGRCDMLADDTTIHTSGKDVPSIVATLQSCVSDIIEWTHINHMSLNPSKTNYMILTTRQKRQILSSPPVQLLVGNKQLHEVSEHKLLGVIIDNNLTWGPHIRYLCKSLAKRVYQSAKIKNFLTFHARKTFFQAHIQSRIDYASTLWDSASESLLKPLKSLHRRAVKIILLKNTSLTNDDYKKTTILPLKHRLMYNKARFMHKILSGKAPTYLVKRVSINLYSRNYSRKLNVPMPRLDLFKSSLMYSGPTLWNSLPVVLTEPSTVSIFKHRLSTHMLTSLVIT